MSLILYLVTSTLSDWLIRMALAIAWFSTVGFHCSSTMKIRFAAVRLRLEEEPASVLKRRPVTCASCQSYPKAPVPVVISITLSRDVDFANSFNIFCLLDSRISPSIRRNGICLRFRYVSAKSRVLVQQEKMIL